MTHYRNIICALGLLTADFFAWVFSFELTARGERPVLSLYVLSGLWVAWFLLLRRKYFRRFPFWTELLGHRVFVEYADTNVPQLDNKSAVEPAYLNGYYRQGYTNGARWIGSAQGGGSRVATLGWLDAHRNMLIKVHRGTVGLSVGAYDPDVNAPKGTLTGLSARRTFDMYRWRLTPELSIMQLSAGQDVGVNKRTNVRLGMEIQIFL